jgi:hypothetical protein
MTEYDRVSLRPRATDTQAARSTARTAVAQMACRRPTADRTAVSVLRV